MGRDGHLDRATALAELLGLAEPGRTRCRAEHVEALIAIGEHARAATLLGQWTDQANRLDRVSARRRSPLPRTARRGCSSPAGSTAGPGTSAPTQAGVAGQLFLGTKTVEANLTRIYRKLHLRSRADLANWHHDRLR